MFLKNSQTFGFDLAKGIVANLRAQNSLKALVTFTNPEFAVDLARASAGKYHVIAIIFEDERAELFSLLKALKVDIVRTTGESKKKVAERVIAHTKDAILIDEHTYPNAFVETFSSLLSELRKECTEKIDNIIIGASADIQIEKYSDVVKKVFGCCETFAAFYSTDSGKLEGSGLMKQVPRKQAYLAARYIIASRGVLCGVSTGAAIVVAKSLKNSICVSFDNAYSYSSTLLNDEWLLEQDIVDDATEADLEAKYRGACVEDLQLDEAVSISHNDLITNAVDIMLSRQFSQLPVVNSKRKMIGFLSLDLLLPLVQSKRDDLKAAKVSKYCTSFKKGVPFVLITPSTSLAELEKFFHHHSFCFVTDDTGKFTLAVVTKVDLLKFLSKRY